MMRNCLLLLAILAMATGCLPTRKDNVAPEPPATVEDSAGDALAVDSTSAVDAGSDAVATDSKGKDVAAAKGCAKNLDCVGFSAPCAVGECDVAAGLCHLVPLAEGATCTDADSCSVATCHGGTCERTPVDCSDANPCTTDSCALTTGCDHAPFTGYCDDGDACTLNDKCLDSACSPGSARKCEDDNPCTQDSCDPKLGCVNVAVVGATPCDDGQKCTDQDACQGKVCSGKPKVCEDDGNDCTLEGCDSTTGQCNHSPLSSILTAGQAVCDDKNPCTKADVCSGSSCAGVPDDCDDGNECTDDSCAAGKGCVHTPTLDNCTKDACSQPGSCQDGVCVASIKSCDDGNACSQDGCDLAKGCTHTVSDGPCGDGDPCTVGDVCVAGACQAGTANSCDDGDPCTTDSCDSVKACVHVQAGPGTSCGSSLQCVAGQCVGSVCGDGLCAYGEDTSSCAKDCPASGGDCAASDASCLSGCRAKKCAGPEGGCSQDAGCVTLSACLGACQDFACEQSCFVAAPVGAVGLFLSDNACVQAFCVADSWLGKKCQAGQGGYAPCVAACTAAMCPTQDVGCQADTSCAKVLACVDQCGQGDQGCVDKCGAKTNALFDARVVCAQTYCQ